MTEVSPGVWRIRYWAADDEGGYRRRSKTVRGTRKDAGDIMAQLRVDHSQDAPQPSVRDCWKRWYLPDARRRVDDGELARQSLEHYESTWRNHVEPRWGGVQVDQVKPLAVQQWLLTLTRSQATGVLPVMRQVLEYAVRFECIPANPMAVKYSMPPKSTSKTLDDGAWSPDELVEVWRACVGTPLEAVVLLCGFGSCRLGEALGARPSDVELREVGGIPIACVRIDSQIDGRGRDTNSVKNRWSERTVVLAGAPALRIVEIAQSSDEYLAEDQRGGAMNQVYARTAFKALLESAGVPHHTPRALRRSWETIARWTLRLPPWLTERMMGHTGGGVTGRSYDRPEVDEFAEALADAWRERGFVADVPTI